MLPAAPTFRTRPPRTLGGWSRHLKQEALGLLQIRNDVICEGCADITIDDPVVERKGQKHDIADDDLAVSNDRLRLHLMNPEDADLWIIDDRRCKKPAPRAQGSDGERRALKVLEHSFSG